MTTFHVEPVDLRPQTTSAKQVQAEAIPFNSVKMGTTLLRSLVSDSFPCVGPEHLLLIERTGLSTTLGYFHILPYAHYQTPVSYLYVYSNVLVFVPVYRFSTWLAYMRGSDIDIVSNFVPASAGRMVTVDLDFLNDICLTYRFVDPTAVCSPITSTQRRLTLTKL